MDGLRRLEPVTSDNLKLACGIEVSPEQEEFVAPVVHSLAEAYVNYESAWPRLVFDGDEAVAFVMGGFDFDNEIHFFRSGIWRLNVDRKHQGKGYGRFAVEALIEEARSRGRTRVTVLWKPGEKGPEAFYLRMGFKPTGEQFFGQLVGELDIA